MIRYKRFVVNPVEENCYVLWDDVTHEGAIVDCGAWSDEERMLVCTFVQDNGISVRYLLQTHMHFDHCLGLGHMSSQYGLVPMCHALDIPIYQTAPMMVQRWFRKDITGTLPQADTCITEASVLALGGISIQVLHTPGHTPGGVCYYVPEAHIVFTGDTLFRMSVGRTDLPGGDTDQELDSIRRKLMVLPADTVILPGHGPESTVETEKAYNPYVR